MSSDELAKSFINKLGLNNHQLVNLAELIVNKVKREYIEVIGMDEFKLIPFSEIRYIQKTKKGQYLIVNSSKKEFYLDIVNEQYLNRFTEFGFRNLDYRTLVNMNLITMYDSDYRRVYFNEDDCLDVTEAAIKQIVKPLLGVQCDIQKFPENHKLRAKFNFFLG